MNDESYTKESGCSILFQKILKDRLADVHFAFVFMTRLPLPHLKNNPPPLARTMWCFPLVGFVIGGCGALMLGGVLLLGLPLSVAAGLGLLTTVLLTGGLHEDGIADVADGFGASASPQKRLDIMRDSRIGTFGTLALLFSVGLRWSALAAFPTPVSAMGAMLLAVTTGRLAQPLTLRLIPPARKDGLSAGAGQPHGLAILTATLLTAALAFLLSPELALLVIGAAIATSLLVSFIAYRAIGGHTGDVIGSSSQGAEITTLLLCVIASSWTGL